MDGRARRFTVADPADGRTLLTVRPYYWGDDPDAGLLANLEAPGIGLEVSWYKYMFRDATSSLPVDDELVSRLTDMLRPVLDSMAARRDARWDPIPLLRARGETGPRDPYGERLHPGRRFGFDVILNGDGNGGEWIAAAPSPPARPPAARPPPLPGGPIASEDTRGRGGAGMATAHRRSRHADGRRPRRLTACAVGGDAWRWTHGGRGLEHVPLPAATEAGTPHGAPRLSAFPQRPAWMSASAGGRGMPQAPRGPTAWERRARRIRLQLHARPDERAVPAHDEHDPRVFRLP